MAICVVLSMIILAMQASRKKYKNNNIAYCTYIAYQFKYSKHINFNILVIILHSPAQWYKLVSNKPKNKIRWI